MVCTQAESRVSNGHSECVRSRDTHLVHSVGFITLRRLGLTSVTAVVEEECIARTSAVDEPVHSGRLYNSRQQAQRVEKQQASRLTMF